MKRPRRLETLETRSEPASENPVLAFLAQDIDEQRVVFHADHAFMLATIVPAGAPHEPDEHIAGLSARCPRWPDRAGRAFQRPAGIDDAVFLALVRHLANLGRGPDAGFYNVAVIRLAAQEAGEVGLDGTERRLRMADASAVGGGIVMCDPAPDAGGSGGGRSGSTACAQAGDISRRKAMTRPRMRER